VIDRSFVSLDHSERAHTSDRIHFAFAVERMNPEENSFLDVLRGRSLHQPYDGRRGWMWLVFPPPSTDRSLRGRPSVSVARAASESSRVLLIVLIYLREKVLQVRTCSRVTAASENGKQAGRKAKVRSTLYGQSSSVRRQREWPLVVC